MHINFLAYVMDLRVLSCERSIFSTNDRVDAAVYMQALEAIIKPWTDSVKIPEGFCGSAQISKNKDLENIHISH